MFVFFLRFLVLVRLCLDMVVVQDQDQTKRYCAETVTKSRQVHDLLSLEQPRMIHVTRCSACSGQLDLPSIHFMCDHSYHQRCVCHFVFSLPRAMSLTMLADVWESTMQSV
jgi:hypothetical protein